MATGRCREPDQIDVDGMKSICGHVYSLKWGPGVAVDLDNLAGEAHADLLLNVLSHPWSHSFASC